MKIVARVLFGLMLVAVIFALGVISERGKNALSAAVWYVSDSFRLVLRDADSGLSGEPDEFLVAARHDGDGVTRNTSGRPDDLILVGGFFDGSPALRLVNRSGGVVANWPARQSELFPGLVQPGLGNPDWQTDLHGFEILPDGSVVFNLEYRGVVKMNRCAAVDWKLPYGMHHSVEFAADGGFWVPGRAVYRAPDQAAYPPYTLNRITHPGQLQDDLILKVSADGQITQSVSLYSLFDTDELRALMGAGGVRSDEFRLGNEGEMFHVNQIEELSAELAADFPMFKAGDLLVSMRTHNMLFVVDPDTWTIKWHRIGPWIRQHSPVFVPGGEIAVFNNNWYRADGLEDAFTGKMDPISNIMLHNPATGQTRIVYGDQPGEAFGSLIRGRVEATPGGGFITTEFEAGRAFETDANRNVVWEYISRYDDTRVTELTGAKVYPADYFTVDDWRCP